MRLLVMPLAALPLFLFAQDPPPAAAPPEVDQALRARAAQFGQYQMEGNFRKAYEMVAEDSQDFFFSAPKEKPQAYTIEDVRYADNFTKATVRVTSTRRMLVGSHLIDLPDVVLEQWRLEDGKWMWYHDPNSARATVIGPIAADEPAKPGALNPKALPPKDLTPEAMTAAAQAALQAYADRPVLEKDSVEFIQGTAGIQQVMVRNNYDGQVKIEVSLSGKIPGLTVEPAEAVINALGETAVKIHYEPAERIPTSATVTIEVQPFRKVYSLSVAIKPAGAATAEPPAAKP